MSARPPSRLLAWAGLLGTLAAVVVVYRVAAQGPFQYDEEAGIKDNVRIRDLSSYRPAEVVRRYLDGSRPVTEATFALNYRFGGLETTGYHATDLVLHLGTVVLVFLLGRRLLARAGFDRPDLPAAAAAALFALHPLQTESVTYTWQRAEVLASLGYVLTLLALEAADRRAGRARGLFVTLSVAAFALGFGAKPIVATAPVAWVLVHLVLTPGQPGRAADRGWRRALLPVVPHIVFGGILSAVTLLSFRGRPDVGFDMPVLGPWRYFLSQPGAVLTYLRLAIWPSGQNIDHDIPAPDSASDPDFLVPALLLSALLGGAIALGRRFRRAWTERGATARTASFGVLFFFLVLSPTSTVAPITDLIAEHRVYLALWGLALAAAAGLWLGALTLSQTRSPRLRLLPGVLLCAALVALAVATVRRNRLWATWDLLWADAVAKSPMKARPHFNLAVGLDHLNRHEEAMAEYRAGLSCKDGTVEPSEILTKLGATLAQVGKGEEAFLLFQRAVSINPRNPNARNNLAVALFDRADLDGAAAQAAAALAVTPAHPGALTTLGEIELKRGSPIRAAERFLAALRLEPDNRATLFNLALAFEMAGRRPDACAVWRRYVRSARTPEEEAEGRQGLLRAGCTS